MNEPLNFSYLGSVIEQYNAFPGIEKREVLGDYANLMGLLDTVFKNLKKEEYIRDMQRFILSKNKDIFLKEAENINAILCQRNIQYFAKL